MLNYKMSLDTVNPSSSGFWPVQQNNRDVSTHQSLDLWYSSRTPRRHGKLTQHPCNLNIVQSKRCSHLDPLNWHRFSERFASLVRVVPPYIGPKVRWLVRVSYVSNSSRSWHTHSIGKWWILKPTLVIYPLWGSPSL